MHKLIQGVHYFKTQIFDPQHAQFAALTKGQKPLALFITCSDSRIDPNLITQSKPGELFVLRNAGNIVPPWGAMGGEAATIEFAVSVLNVRDIVVCGHTCCGAMEQLLKPEQVADLPSVVGWLAQARLVRSWLDAYCARTGTPPSEAAAQLNTLLQLDNLRTYPAVAERLVTGKVSLHAWVYRLETGQVVARDPARGKFVPLSDTPGLSLAADVNGSNEDMSTAGGQ
jgi:carbonic anhydrase